LLFNPLRQRPRMIGANMRVEVGLPLHFEVADKVK
jgi:hypothetical protein